MSFEDVPILLRKAGLNGHKIPAMFLYCGSVKPWKDRRLWFVCSGQVVVRLEGRRSVYRCYLQASSN